VLSRWPIRNKLIAGLALLVVIVAIASGSGLYGLYAYRAMVKSISARAYELPLSTALMREASNLRVALCVAQSARAGDSVERIDQAKAIQSTVAARLQAIEAILGHYQWQLGYNQFEVRQFSAGSHERRVFSQVEETFERMVATSRRADWATDPAAVVEIMQQANRLEELAFALPAYLHSRMKQLATDVRTQYRALIWLSWVTTIIGGLLLTLLVKLFYDWVFRPLRILIRGSRRVAGGEFSYRIRLDNQDEMAELADAMNDMTARFQAIHDDLDQQVKERTQQVVRSEQMASVGFLAAGVAHEINNPLASIAICAESLESRLSELLEDRDGQQQLVRQYLSMIQSEAFRCKEITERLLDFSRIGDVQRQPTEMRELVQGVIDMVRHLGKYQGKHVELAPGNPLWAMANAQEMKQVILNLLTNALDSVDAGGLVHVELNPLGNNVQLIVSDNGCGMTPEVLKHLFEPFFTRKRGGQGTGLGLSITYRIVAEHGGHIDATSAGPGQGSQFRVTLPSASLKEVHHHYQAA
jgi:signal transduction histidine kinase